MAEAGFREELRKQICMQIAIVEAVAEVRLQTCMQVAVAGGMLQPRDQIALAG